jgi:hypothetical protein
MQQIGASVYVPDGVDPHAFGNPRKVPLGPRVSFHARAS